MKQTKRVWKFYCEEDKHPGMWQRWLKNQCVAVGWADVWGFYLCDSPKRSKQSSGWIRVRNCLNEIQIGDCVVASLQGNRIGRIGEVTKLEIDKWDPLVPRNKKGKDEESRDGGIGRRIQVRWDTTAGPDNRDFVVHLPKEARLSPGKLRPTIAEISWKNLECLRSAMNDQRNWVSLFEFRYEKSLSDYIAAFPHRLEDGLLPHPNIKIRELEFSNKKRADVVLTDKNDKPVIVECKQGEPTVENIKQLKGYLIQFRKKKGKLPGESLFTAAHANCGKKSVKPQKK